MGTQSNQNNLLYKDYSPSIEENEDIEEENENGA